MRYDALDRVEEMASTLEAHAGAAEDRGQLPDESAKAMRHIGVIRLLQPRAHGGYEADPREFLETVMKISHHCTSAGWVAGIVGVHSWEIALCDPRLQDEIWGKDPDTWVASPYAPNGKVTPVDGGYILNGRWQFSSGTDQCQWIVLGGVQVDPGPKTFHLYLPRSDYEIVDDSWNVVGLKGSGSKDIVVRDAFVPAYRTIDASSTTDGTAAKVAGVSQPLYRMPWSGVFPNGITAAVIGICEGALAEAFAYQRDRASFGMRAVNDSHAMAAIGEAASEIDASRTHLLHNVGKMFEMVVAGQEVSLEQRAAGRRDQVKAAWRAVAAVDQVFATTGGNALRLERSLQRFWRDAHAGLNHVIHVAPPVYAGYSRIAMGLEATGPYAASF